MHTNSYIQSGRTVTERRCAHQQLRTVRQNCHRGIAPTVIYSQAELSQRGGVRTNSYRVRQICHREEVCAPTVIYSQDELSQRGVAPTVTYSQAELSQKGGVHTKSYTVRAVREEVCTLTIIYSQAELS